MSMRSLVVIVVWFLCYTPCWTQTDLLYETTRISATEENEICRTEGGRTWLCKKVTECPSSRKVLQSGGKLQTCSWKGARTHIVCCPPEAASDRQPLTQSVSIRKCDEYQRLLCKNGVYQPPTATFSQGGSKERTKRQILAVYGGVNAKPASHPYMGGSRGRTKRQDFHIQVFGGMNAKPASHPYMALIGYGEADSISWQCGGSLVSERFVLSAAHCSDTPYGPASWARLGDLDLDSNSEDASPQQFQILERLVHSGYSSPAYYNDIVLFRLDRQAVFDKYVGPACLYQSVADIEGSGIATGWGKNESNAPRTSALQEVVLKFVPTERCKNAVGKVQKLLAQGLDGRTMLCAGEPGKDTCQGDSGGPLTLSTKAPGNCLATQVGVTSFGPRFCGITEVPGSYVRVAYFLPWIESVVWPTS